MAQPTTIYSSAQVDLHLVKGETFNKSIVYKEAFRDLFDGDGATTTFTLTTDLTQRHKVKVGDSYLSSTQYSISYGTGASSEDQVIFTTAPDESYDNIIIEYLSPFDFTGYEGDMDIRTNQKDSIQKLTLGPTAPPDNGTVVLGASRGSILINIPYAATDTIDFIDGKYDLFMLKTDLTDRKRVMWGFVTTDLSVTQ